jgi:hypothetical protein
MCQCTDRALRCMDALVMCREFLIRIGYVSITLNVSVYGSCKALQGLRDASDLVRVCIYQE